MTTKHEPCIACGFEATEINTMEEITPPKSEIDILKEKIEIAKQALGDLFQRHSESCPIVKHPMVCLGCDCRVGDQNAIITAALAKLD